MFVGAGYILRLLPNHEEFSMPKSLLFRFAAILVVGALLAAIFLSWRADRRDRAQLVDELAAAKQALSAATARQEQRDSQLVQTLAQLAAQKRTVVTPAEVVRELPREIPLPSPIVLQAHHPSSQNASVQATNPESTLAEKSAGVPPSGDTHGKPALSAGAIRIDIPQPKEKPELQTQEKLESEGAYIPHDDLKPLYDFALDCKACQAKLAAAQADLSDEKLKTATLTKERDEAMRAAQGGSIWRRIGRAAKWFVIGAAAGAIAAKAAG
jgi:type II secretory pathway pseudopilin PulG